MPDSKQKDDKYDWVQNEHQILYPIRKQTECWGCGGPMGADMQFTVGCPGCDLGQVVDALTKEQALMEDMLVSKSDIVFPGHKAWDR